MVVALMGALLEQQRTTRLLVQIPGRLLSVSVRNGSGGFKRSAQHLVERHHRRSKSQNLLRSSVQLPRNGIELSLVRCESLGPSEGIAVAIRSRPRSFRAAKDFESRRSRRRPRCIAWGRD